MPTPVFRLRTPLLALLAAALLLPASATATVTSSSITAPAGPGSAFYPLYDGTPATATITATGTAAGTGTARAICTFTDADAASSIDASPAAALGGGGAFSLPVDLQQMVYTPCRLGAYDTVEGVPADPSPFTGPLVLVQQVQSFKRATGGNTGQAYDYYDAFVQHRSVADFLSITSCGLCDMGWADTTLPRPLRARDTWETGAAFYSFNGSTQTRTRATIDGHDTLFSDDVSGDVFSDYANFPALTTTATPAADGTAPRLTESVEPVRCQDDAFTTINHIECTSFTKLGVRWDRAFTSTADGRTWHVDDRVTSIDGQAHELDLQYSSYLNGGGSSSGGSGLSAPWTGTPGFLTTGGAPRTIGPPPALPASMLVDIGLNVADGDPDGPAGSLTVGPGFTGATVDEFAQDEILTKFKRTVPAGGSTTISMAFSAVPTQADARAAAAAAEELIRNPGGPVTPPAPGPATSTPAPTPAPDTAAPAITGAKLSAASFRTGVKGTRLTFSSSEAGTAKLVLSRKAAGRRKGTACVKPTRKLRRARSCTRLVRVKTISRSITAGANSIVIAPAGLAPGSYSATLTVTDAAGNAGAPVTKGFVVKRAPKRR